MFGHGTMLSIHMAQQVTKLNGSCEIGTTICIIRCEEQYDLKKFNKKVL